MARWLGILWIVAATPALATTVTTFEGCTDAAGQAIAVEADRDQAALIQSVDIQGTPVIRYNPAALPHLTPEVRLFFFAQACARHTLNMTGAAALTLAQARQADCLGLHTLFSAGLLQREALADLQPQLVFTDAEWSLLPGPPRTIDVTSCPTRGNVLRLPLATPPAASQIHWNTCVNTCADRLWHCQKGCRGAACGNCTENHVQCHAACGAAPEK